MTLNYAAYNKVPPPVTMVSIVKIYYQIYYQMFFKT